ncbi:Circadian clock protein KaiC/DNA repair protein RadA [Moelleriella libera RCEF 2490]|uniref:Circadian clock protein KaiC/DNA repair protein RadA n=1 Tax=Moelleriella libera RCEF 2490 TaxID=1081109 RepID=A0A168F786_9HYPO|nr:Circadian clock protein KaiC/DNA repair protein RadA [Moelleriella libera RCEF 2490]
MDYHDIHGHDVSSFDIVEAHRMPTVQASQVFRELQDDSNSFIPTGIESLDDALASESLSQLRDLGHSGGIKKGQVTELWGPPGTGKTAVLTQVAANAIRRAGDVVWIDCFHHLQTIRLKQTVEKARESARKSPERDGDDDGAAQGKFIHFSCLTLPHFMALVSRPNAKAIPGGVALCVVSGLSSLINSSLPKNTEDNAGAKSTKASMKRRQALQFIINALQRLAATKNCAVVVMSHCASRMHSEQGATLVTAVNTSVWDQGISTRMCMFRDWARKDGKLVPTFLAGVQKVEGKANTDGPSHIAAFDVHSRLRKAGITNANYHTAGIPEQSSEPGEASRHKRKLGHADFEVPDSEDDENYGWADDDESTLPAPPPQWQGSEDTLLGQDVGQADDEYEGSSTHTSASENND